MKTIGHILIGLLVYFPASWADEMPCQKIEFELLGNLTKNQNCETMIVPCKPVENEASDSNASSKVCFEESPYKDFCRQFSDCISKYQICVDIGGVIVGGNTEKDFNKHYDSIVFGVNQSLKFKQQHYCVWAGMGQDLGGESPPTWWHYSISPFLYPGEMPDNGGPKTLTEFIQSTTAYFRKSIPADSKQVEDQ